MGGWMALAYQQVEMTLHIIWNQKQVAAVVLGSPRKHSSNQVFMCRQQEWPLLLQEFMMKKSREAGSHCMMKGCIMHVRQCFDGIK
jgi:hypothetical protein